MSDIAAKARRAAEWFTAQGWDVRHRGERWRLYSPDFEEADIYDRKDFAGENRLLIAYAEQEGWQDHVPDAGNMVDNQEADGVGRVRATEALWEARRRAKETGDCTYVRPSVARCQGYTWDFHYSEDAVCRIYPGGRMQALTVEFGNEVMEAKKELGNDWS